MSWKASSQVLRRVWLTAGRAARFGGAFEEDLDLDVAAGDALAYRGAEGGFDGVEFHGHVEIGSSPINFRHPFCAELDAPIGVHVEQAHRRAPCRSQADNVSASDYKVIAPYVGTRIKQCHHGACSGIDARKIRSLVSVAAVTCQRQPGGIAGTSVLLRNDMFDMESDQGRRPLWHAAILTSITGAPSNNLPKTLIHPMQIAGRGSGVPLPA
jgi:hypothetical protein